MIEDVGIVFNVVCVGKMVEVVVVEGSVMFEFKDIVVMLNVGCVLCIDFKVIKVVICLVLVDGIGGWWMGLLNFDVEWFMIVVKVFERWSGV